MTVREKIEHIIQEIEDMSINTYTSADEIAESISNKIGVSMRDINAISKFLNNQTFLEYIKNRKMMAALKDMLSQDEFNCFRAVSLSGFDNQQSFTKSFSQKFGISPQKAYEANRKDLYIEPPSWDELSERDYQQENRPVKRIPLESSHFGVSASVYDQLKLMMELEDLYALPPECSEIAYNLIVKYQVAPDGIKEIFKYISDWYEMAPIILRTDHSITARINFVRSMAYNPVLLYLCFDLGMSTELAFTTQTRIPETVDILSLDKQFLFEFAHISDMKFSFYQDAYAYFRDYLDSHPNTYDEYDSLENYTKYLCIGYPKEEAIDYLIEDDWKDIKLYSLEELKHDMDSDGFSEEELYADELDYSEGQIDQEPDMDNLWYTD